MALAGIDQQVVYPVNGDGHEGRAQWAETEDVAFNAPEPQLLDDMHGDGLNPITASTAEVEVFSQQFECSRIDVYSPELS